MDTKILSIVLILFLFNSSFGHPSQKSNSGSTCFLSSYNVPQSEPQVSRTNSINHPSAFFSRDQSKSRAPQRPNPVQNFFSNDGQMKIDDKFAPPPPPPPPVKGNSGNRISQGQQPPPPVKGNSGNRISQGQQPPPQTKGRPQSGYGSNAGLRIGPESQGQNQTQFASSTMAPPSGSTTQKTNYLRPAQRPPQTPGVTGRQGLPPMPPFRQIEPQFVNQEELDTIALFEAALERSRHDFGTRNSNYVDRRSQSINDQRSPLPKSPARVRPRMPPAVPPTHFFNLDFDDGRSSNPGKTNQRMIEQKILEVPPPTRAIMSTSTTSTTPEPISVQQQELDDGFDMRSLFDTSPRFMSWLERSRMVSNMRIAPDSNFTVLVPSDSAIDMLPSRFIDDLESNSTRMREVLFYHIIPLAIDANVLQDGENLPTLYFKRIRVTKDDPVVSMSGSKIVSGPKIDSGGKITFYNVDRVLFPPRGSIYSIISTTPELSILSKMVDESGIRSELAFDGPFTFFAPSNDAFEKLDSESMTYLTSDPLNTRDFVLRLVSKPVVFTANLRSSQSTSVQSALGDKMTIKRVSDDLVEVDDVRVTYADIFATNGVLHVLDTML